MHSQNSYIRIKAAIHEAVGLGMPGGLSETFVALDFRCGNIDTLNTTTTVKKVKAFYDRFYTKSKTVILTRGRSKNLDLASIDTLLKQIDADVSPDSMRPSPVDQKTSFMNQPVPELQHNTFVFVSTVLKPRVTIKCFLNGTDTGYTHFMIKEFEMQLRNLLINKLSFSDYVEVEYTNHGTFYEVEFDVELSETGIVHVAKVVGIIRQAVLKTPVTSVLEKSRFLQYKLRQQQKIFLQKREVPSQGSFNKLMRNYIKYGVSGIFAEDKLPGEYDEKKISDALDKLRKAPWIVVYNDRFTVANENEHPSTEISIESFIRASSTGTRLSLHSIDGSDVSAESKLQLQPEPKNEVPYTGFNTTTASLDSLVDLSPLKETDLVIAQPSRRPYLIKESTVAAMVKSFSPTLRTTLDLEWKLPKPTDLVFEGSYPNCMSLPLVEIVFDLNFEAVKPNIVEYFQLMFASEVIKDRLSDLDYELKGMGGGLLLKASPSGMQFSLSVLPSQAATAMDDVKKALQETNVTEDEWRNALNKIGSQAQVVGQPFMEALLMFETWACPYLPNKFMVQAHFEKALNKPPIKTLPKLFVTNVIIIKQQVPPGLSELVPNINSDNIGQFLPLKANAGFSNGPESLKDVNYFTNNNHTTVALPLKTTATTEISPGVFLMVVPLGKRTAKLAQIMGILRPLFHTAVYRHLRRELNIGYVTAVQSKGFLGEFYLQVVVQSDKQPIEIDAAMVEVINRLRTQVASLTEETLGQLKSLTAGIIVTPFESISSEAEFWKNVMREGLGPTYFQDSLAAAKSITLAEVKEAFHKSFAPDTFLNIILDLQSDKKRLAEEIAKDLLNYG